MQLSVAPGDGTRGANVIGGETERRCVWVWLLKNLRAAYDSEFQHIIFSIYLQKRFSNATQNVIPIQRFYCEISRRTQH